MKLRTILIGILFYIKGERMGSMQQINISDQQKRAKLEELNPLNFLVPGAGIEPARC